MEVLLNYFAAAWVVLLLFVLIERKYRSKAQKVGFYLLLFVMISNVIR